MNGSPPCRRPPAVACVERAKLQGIALAGLFQIIITEAGQRTLDGQTQDQVADKLLPAIQEALEGAHPLERLPRDPRPTGFRDTPSS
jgi:hypothetical protein